MIDTSAPAPSIMTIQDVAEYLGVHVMTAYRLASKRAIPGAFKVGKRWRFKKESLDRYLENGHSKPSPDVLPHQVPLNVLLAEAIAWINKSHHLDGCSNTRKLPVGSTCNCGRRDLLKRMHLVFENKAYAV